MLPLKVGIQSQDLALIGCGSELATDLGMSSVESITQITK